MTAKKKRVAGKVLKLHSSVTHQVHNETWIRTYLMWKKNKEIVSHVMLGKGEFMLGEISKKK